MEATVPEGTATRDRVVVFDTTLRDGEQAAGVAFSLEDKIEIARALDAMRVDVIEAGFPATSDVERTAVEAVAREVRGARVCALARAVPGDVDAAVAAVRGAVAPRVHVFVSSSDVHMVHQLGRDREAVVGMVDAMVRRARSGVEDVEFSPMDSTRSEPGFVAEIVRTAIRAGARTVNLPDTVGYATPDGVAAMVRAMRERVPEIEDAVISFHGHDDLGFATANAMAAIGAGARQVEVTVNGIGERAGNTALEEVVMAIHVHGEGYGVRTGVDTTRICDTSRLVAGRSGLVVPRNKAIVGGNAFRHASGIHQDGVVKLRETYEVLDPRDVGHATGTEIVLGKLSGRAGFAARCRSIGIELGPGDVDRAFARFQEIADRRREVTDDDLRRIAEAA